MNENRFMDAVTQGVYVLGVKDEAKVNFMTAAWLTQVSANPKKVLVAVSKNHYTAEMIRHTGKFTVNVLGKGQEELARKFGSSSGKNTDKSQGADYELKDEQPVLRDTAAYMICTVTRQIEDGDHVLFIGQIKEGRKFDKIPMIYNEKTFF